MASSLIEPGFRLGKYEVVAHLATGGMGAVYKAVDRDLNRLVALKILSSDLADDTAVMERFRREARHAARLNHPHIVTLYEFRFDRKRRLYYLALEFINGVDLARYIARRRQLRPEETRRIMVQTAKALAHAFEHGIVHRDIKPSNLMLAKKGGKGVVKITDLGLAIAVGEDEYRVTREGNTVGTIDYISPEQARDSRSADTRSDIYSLGCTAFHMLAGRPPFAEGGLGERLFKHLEAPPPDVRAFNSAVSAEFWAIIRRMLAKKPEDRFASPNELLWALKGLAVEDLRKTIPISRRCTEHVSAGPTRLAIPAKSTSVSYAAQAEPGSEAPTISTEQSRAAAAFHQHALQVLAQGGGDDYARQLLDNCLKLDPFNVAARKSLRDLNRKCNTGVLSRLLGSLNMIAVKSKMRLARSSGDWRRVFEHAEQVLARQPSDADTHIELAETATELGLPELARWFLKEGRQEAPDSAELMRALARLHEHLHEWKPAIALWQQVVEIEPTNREAHRKINDLSAQDLMASGHYHKG
jgi:serine/threonine protein kinase